MDPRLTIPKRSLGATGIEVSVLGLGTVKLGRTEGVKYPTHFTPPDDAEARRLLDNAAAFGINLLDTAPAYGTSEERLGGLLRGRRDQWVIATKVGEEFENGLSRHCFTAEHTKMSVERSLRRLRTDRLDVVLIHSDGNDQEILRDGAAIQTLQNLKDEGKIRAFGISTKTVAGGLDAVEVCDLVMVYANPWHLDEIPVITAAAERNRGILIKKAFASGHFGQQPDADPAGESIRFLLGMPAVSSIVVGTINPAHMESNARVASLPAPCQGNSARA